MSVSAKRRALRIALDVLGGLLLLGAVVVALYYWDPTRLQIKRLSETDPHLYDEVEPRFAAEDPAPLVTARSADTVDRLRSDVIDVIWGSDGVPNEGLPESVRKVDLAAVPPECEDRTQNESLRALNCEAPKYVGWENLAEIQDLGIAVGPDYIASVAYFRPRRGNGILVLYQHGFAGTYHFHHRLLEALIAAGYTVAATSLPNYGDNICKTPQTQPWCAVSSGRFEVPLPLRVYFTPLAAAINYARREDGIEHVAMIGFSAGAWVAAVMAAADTRIERSYPVAGVIPFYMRRPKEWPPNEIYPPLMDTAGMLDLFVLGASGPSRSQLQVYNRFDRCCYNGPRPLLYEQAVKTAVRETGGGAFDLVLDETHARHKISRWAFEHIFEDLQRPWKP